MYLVKYIHGTSFNSRIHGTRDGCSVRFTSRILEPQTFQVSLATSSDDSSGSVRYIYSSDNLLGSRHITAVLAAFISIIQNLFSLSRRFPIRSHSHRKRFGSLPPRIHRSLQSLRLGLPDSAGGQGRPPHSFLGSPCAFVEMSSST